MDTTKADPRITKTKAAIRSAFLKLLAQKGFPKLTVKDIIQEAQINRSTFYAHYTDKYDLLNCVEQELLDNLNTAELSDGLIKSDGSQTILESVLSSRARLLKDNGQLFALLMSENGDPAFADKLGESIYRIWTSSDLRGRFVQPDNYAMAALIGILSGILNEWVRGGFKETPDELASIVVSLIAPLPKQLVSL